MRSGKQNFKAMIRAEDDGFPIAQVFGKDSLGIFANYKEGKMPIRQLKKYLDHNRVQYEVISHSTVYTAQETAQNAHIPGKEMAKTIIVRINDKMAMVVLPASTKIELELLRETVDAEKVKLASEAEFRDLFPDCEIGAMPPFGNLYNMPVYVANKLTEDEEIAFNAGNHSELIKMKFSDFKRLVKPKIVDVAFAYQGH